ncbi:MAG TPA: hypothetical protein VK764_11445 [Terracidiphilus sp.]|jgi:hypothetical protein|nr:hypothetical protein [Terracidiphilus sp.]
MNRQILVVAFFAAASAALVAQETSQTSPYQGTSTPPPDETIITDTPDQPQAKPPAGHPMSAPADSTAPRTTPATSVPNQSVNPNAVVRTGSDSGIVQPAPGAPPSDLATGPVLYDPDGDIVHPTPLGPGELREGTMIRVRLQNDLSSSFTEQGQPFRSRVASDVLEGGNIVIPAGSEISGRVVEVSSGHFGGHGTMILHPETVTLPNGESFHLHAMVSSAPGTHTRVGAEGTISPDSRLKRDGIEYGAVVGGGAITGAMLGGPVGALAGTLVGAGVVTTHLLVSHPQAHLDSGDVLMLTLTERTHLEPATNPGN